MKLLMLVSDGFEDTELIATLDILTRGGIEVTLASIMKRKEITPKLGRTIVVDSLIEDINKDDYEGLIIPGGPGSFKIMPKIETVNETIHHFAKENKLVAAICAAPHLIGQLGYLKDRNYTVHPGFEQQIIGGHYLKNEGVVVSDNFITAKSMYYSISFGLAIVEYFFGKEYKNKLEESCKGN